MVSIHIETSGGLFICILEETKQRKAEEKNNSLYTENKYKENKVWIQYMQVIVEIVDQLDLEANLR